MQNHGDRDDRTDDVGLTTEDIAHPQAGPPAPSTREDEERQVPVYPGEATAGTQDDAGAPGPATTEPGSDQEQVPAADEPLLGAEDAEGYRKTWSDIQGRFVDDPQDAVRSADALVAEVMQALAQTFSSRKQGLEGQWDQGEQVATEELRLALQQYRSFFNRLLNT
ncbi:hypothetical protein AB0I68_26715 [Streptomyces sp. NPDC050448]|uniref:hypothetical protein n=1 Tax=Streptomyces sp. NPDC050448 TaxID=3155404 RepID=UPI0034471586